MRSARDAHQPAVSVTKQSHATTSKRRSAQRDSAPADNFARAPKQVRIIGGRWKRTSLPVRALVGLRPTPDRVRETLFNWIEHLVPNLEDVRGIDLFAGTGALGFELASRGAQRVTLIESDRQSLDQLAQTKRKLAADQVDVIAADALSAAARWPAASFEIIFVDPPFDSELLAPAVVAAARLVTPEGLVYVESGAPIEDAKLTASGWRIERSSRAGRVFFCLLRPASA